MYAWPGSTSKLSVSRARRYLPRTFVSRSASLISMPLRRRASRRLEPISNIDRPGFYETRPSDADASGASLAKEASERRAGQYWVRPSAASAASCRQRRQAEAEPGSARRSRRLPGASVGEQREEKIEADGEPGGRRDPEG